jgi:hypothetical protein
MWAVVIISGRRRAAQFRLRLARWKDHVKVGAGRCQYIGVRGGETH